MNKLRFELRVGNLNFGANNFGSNIIVSTPKIDRIVLYWYSVLFYRNLSYLVFSHLVLVLIHQTIKQSF